MGRIEFGRVVYLFLFFALFPFFAVISADSAVKGEAKSAEKGEGSEKTSEKADYMKVCVLPVAKSDKVSEYVKKFTSREGGGSLQMQVVKDTKEADPEKIGFLCVIEMERAVTRERTKSIGNGWGAILSADYCSGTYAVQVSKKGKWKKLGTGALNLWKKRSAGEQVTAMVLSHAISVTAKTGNQTGDNVPLIGTVSSSLPLVFEGVGITAPYAISVSGWGEGGPPSLPVADALEPKKSVRFSIVAPLFTAEHDSAGSRDLRLHFLWKDAYASEVRRITLKTEDEDEGATINK